MDSKEESMVSRLVVSVESIAYSVRIIAKALEDIANIVYDQAEAENERSDTDD